MENYDEFYLISIQFSEVCSELQSPLIACIEVKLNDAAMMTNEFKLNPELQLIDDILSFKLDQFQRTKCENKFELFLISDDEIVGKGTCNFQEFIDRIDKGNAESFQQYEQVVQLTGKVSLQTKIRLSVKLLDWQEGFSARTTIYPNIVTDAQNCIIQNLKQDVDTWKQKYEHVRKEIDQLSKELTNLQVRDKASSNENHINELNHLRRTIKCKLQNFLQIYENQEDQIHLIKKELNNFRKKICNQCSEALHKNSTMKQSDKINHLSATIEKKNLEIVQLHKIIDDQKFEIKSLQKNIVQLHQQQGTLRFNLNKQKNQNNILQDDCQALLNELNQKNSQITFLNKENIIKQNQLNEQNEKYQETIDLYKQWSLSIVKAVELESKEKNEIIEALFQLQNQLSVLHDSTLDQEVQKCECQIQQHIQKYKIQIQQLENLLCQYQTRLQNNQQSASIHRKQSSRESLSFIMENCDNNTSSPYRIDDNKFDQLKNQIEQKDCEITMLKQKIGDILNLALELGNSMLIERIQLTIM